MTDATEILEPEPSGPPIFELDRLHCTEEELNAVQRDEMEAYFGSFNGWVDVTKTDGYWKLSDQHREEWVARVALRKKAEPKKGEEAA